ncbi:MAG TPA: hypothetical protein VNT54_03060 [Solirubrobacteraceae bacterium]|nr:hypothetical protein [Solirubrobacteraceae bacterium]
MLGAISSSSPAIAMTPPMVRSPRGHADRAQNGVDRAGVDERARP